MLRHVLPNVIGPVLVIATINLGARHHHRGDAVVPRRRHAADTMPSLGTLIRIGNNYLFAGEWWIVAFPGIALAVLVLADQPARRLAARRAQSEAAMTVPVLSVRNLEVEFLTRRGTLRAIDGVSFDIAQGEVLGVVGESGAGKSVTGSAVIGLIDPPGRIAGGEIRLSGTRIDNLPPEEMRQHPRQAHRHDLPGPADQPQSALPDRRPARRDDPDPLPICRRPRRASAPSICWPRSASRRRSSASTAIRTSSPAACASAS